MVDGIKKIEDLSLNAWPSYQMQVYDGWILRFSHFYTHRTNCAEQIGPSALPLSEKIGFTESAYRKWGTPCIFKVAPVGDPALDRLLEERGYGIEHETTVMTRSLGDEVTCRRLPEDVRLVIRERVDDVWLDALFSLKRDVSPLHKRIVPQMYAAIPMDEIAVSAVSGDRVIGTGLGILDRGSVGVYAIHVEEEQRRRGIASAIVGRILIEAKRRGAEDAYLQVVSDNQPAKVLYRSIGFSDCYRYYFRIKALRD